MIYFYFKENKFIFIDVNQQIEPPDKKVFFMIVHKTFLHRKII